MLKDVLIDLYSRDLERLKAEVKELKHRIEET